MPNLPHSKHQQALPLHLTLAMLPLLASRAALTLSKNGSPRLNMPSPGLHPPAIAGLQKAWETLQNNVDLAQAVETEARKRAAELLSGVYKYTHSQYTRDIAGPPAVMTIGSTRLLDYGASDADAPVVFLIPSLINRYYIMDLTRKLSFARHLRERGIRVFMVDWRTPSAAESHFNTALYVTEILVPMAEYIRADVSGHLTYGGYCMGGLLALALACVRPELADGIAFFATPWDFTAPGVARFAMREQEITDLKNYIRRHDSIPPEFIHTLFHYANPYAFQSKLREFAYMEENNPATRDFIAVEDWVNDGVTMTRGVAEDCLIGWAQYNLPAKLSWRVGGQIIDPRKLCIPAFVSAPRNDKIVPSDCALALVKLLKNCTLIEPRSGHISMMTGRQRKSALWEPFCRWVEERI